MNDNINKACDVLRLYGYQPHPQAPDQVLYRKGALEFRIETQSPQQARVTVPLDDLYDYRVNLPVSSNIAEYIELHLKALHEKAWHEKDDPEYGNLKDDGDMSNIYSFVYEAYYQQ